MIEVKLIDNLLPQTQCGECGYPGCLPYAEALANGSATIDHCPPGGVKTVQALGALLGVDPAPYLAQAKLNTRPFAAAIIRETECIGCTKCIQACPVDAIVGSAKMMHTVLTHECTGCGLCVEPCPVDCIDMQPYPEPTYDPNVARKRYQARQSRLLREEYQKQQQYREKKQIATAQGAGEQHDQQAKQDYILQALARSQAKKNHE
jgi:electron transport complex protein RnfB